MKRRDFLKLTPDERRAFFMREVVGKKLTRSFTVISRDAINEAERTVEIAFSSDEPYERWFYTEILSHDAKAIMLKRLNNGGAFLKDHDTRQQIGVVVPGTAKSDGHVARCTVKFSQRQLAQDEFQDVLDGIRTKISVGYEIHKYEYDEKSETLTATLWEPLENSTVAIPADDSVGVGRSRAGVGGQEPGDGEEADPVSGTRHPAPDKPSQKNQTHPAQTAPVAAQSGATRTRQLRTRKPMALRRRKTQPAVDERELTCAEGDPDCNDERCDVHFEAAAERADESPETREARRVVDFARIFGEEQLALDMVAEGKNLADVRAAIQAKRKQRAKDTTPAPEDPNVSANRNGGNVIQFPRHGRLRNFQGEGATERAYRFMQWFLAGPMGRAKAQTWCKEHGIPLVEERAHTEGVNEDGGFLVPHEFGNDMIDLREQFGVFRRLANVVPMATETKSEPRRTGGLTAYFVGETDAVTESKAGWDRINLVAKVLGVLTKLSLELNEDSMVGMGDKLIGEIAYAFAEKEDQCGFNGDGTSTYGGIRGIRNKLLNLSSTRADIAGLVVGSGNLWSELVLTDFEAVVARLPEYADTPNTRWVCSRAFYYNVMVKLMLAAGGVTAAEITDKREKRFMGYQVEISQAFPKSEANDVIPVIFGDVAKGAMFGDRRGTTIAQSEHTDFANRLLAILGTERFDINVHDVGNAHATAASRVPGPIVALATAAS